MNTGRQSHILVGPLSWDCRVTKLLADVLAGNDGTDAARNVCGFRHFPKAIGHALNELRGVGRGTVNENDAWAGRTAPGVVSDRRQVEATGLASRPT